MRAANSDQTAHSRSLIWVFADGMCLLQPQDYPKGDKREPLPYWVDAQGYLKFDGHIGLIVGLVMRWFSIYYSRDGVYYTAQQMRFFIAVRLCVCVDGFIFGVYYIIICPHLSFAWYLGKALLRDCGMSWVPSLMSVYVFVPIEWWHKPICMWQFSCSNIWMGDLSTKLNALSMSVCDERLKQDTL